jgi:hypothetical protein
MLNFTYSHASHAETQTIWFHMQSQDTPPISPASNSRLEARVLHPSPRVENRASKVSSELKKERRPWDQVHMVSMDT